MVCWWVLVHSSPQREHIINVKHQQNFVSGGDIIKPNVSSTNRDKFFIFQNAPIFSMIFLLVIPAEYRHWKQ
jgi:hypothetical protein